LVVLRTLSKAHALAGARIGAVIGNEDIIALVRKVIAPYPISILCYNAALDVLAPASLADTKEKVALIKTERERLYQCLQDAKDLIKVWPSATNFLLVIAKDADHLYQKLQCKNIIVRNWNKVIQGGLRITVGTPQENQQFLTALGLS
jgi:histidinol-phosphate aminotransferase